MGREVGCRSLWKKVMWDLAVGQSRETNDSLPSLCHSQQLHGRRLDCLPITSCSLSTFACATEKPSYQPGADPPAQPALSNAERPML